MAKSKFSDIYKQELNSKGVMSSLGSAALKQTRERMDIRNSLFGGTGAISRTGQKIFGKGYSAMGGNAAKLSGRSNSPMQGASIDALVISNQKQERLLKIVAKNTMNMNMMARDMNITRQNIASMTRKATGGKAANRVDSSYMNASKRNAQVDGMPKRGAAPGASGGIMSSIFGGIGSVLSGGAGIIGSVVTGLLGVVGGVGGGILSAIGGILGGIPGGWLLGTIALAGIAYLLKEVAANTDFKGLKDDILKGLGLDPDNKEKTLKQQILEKLGFSEETSKDISDTIENLDKQIMKVFKPAADKFDLYSKTAFTTLAKIFENVGKKFGFAINDFFADNKLAIITSLAVGIASAAGILLPVAKIAAMMLALGSGLELAKASSKFESPDSLKKGIDILDKINDIQLIETVLRDKKDAAEKAYKDELVPVPREAKKKQYLELQKNYDEVLGVFDGRRKLIDELQDANPLLGLNEKGENIGFKDTDGNRRKGMQKRLDAMIKERADVLNFNSADFFKDELKKNSPTPVNNPAKNAKIIYDKFREAGYSDIQAKAAIANALAESQLDATIQSNVVKNGVREESYGLFQINRKKHPEYTIDDLKDPVKNTDAMLEIMRTKHPKDDKYFKGITDQDKATEEFMKKFEIPGDTTGPKVQERIIRIPEVDKLLKDSEQKPVSLTNNYITNVAGSSGSNQYASPYNFLDGEIFYKNAYA